MGTILVVIVVNEMAVRVVDLLLEMPVITRKGKQVLAGDKPLKGVPTEVVDKNIVFIRCAEAGFLWPKGFTLVYFMDSEESAKV